MSDVLAILQFGVLVALLGVTGFLLLVTVTNRMRLRRIVMTWRAGRFYGIPVAPALFLALLVAGAVALGLRGYTLDAPVLAGFLTAGGLWLAGAWIGGAVVITDYGIVTSLSGSEHVVAWGQVADYFQFRRGGRAGFVFIYQDVSGVRRRLELSIPADSQKRFQQVVRAKLDSRFEFATRQAYGKTTTEG